MLSDWLSIISCMFRVLSWIARKTCAGFTGLLCEQVRATHRLPLGSYSSQKEWLKLCVCMQQLPVRGQTTKNNARTRKGKPVAIAGKKK